MIYHIALKEDWEKAQKQGSYIHPSLEAEGFIHCSEDRQVSGVLNRYFKGKTDLLKLTINPQQLSSPLQYELAPSVNEEFPHIYGPINLDAVIEVRPISEGFE